MCFQVRKAYKISRCWSIPFRQDIRFPITKTRLFKYIEKYTTQKGKKNQKKHSDIFHIPDQTTDCGYSLEPPRWGGSNEYP